MRTHISGVFIPLYVLAWLSSSCAEQKVLPNFAVPNGQEGRGLQLYVGIYIESLSNLNAVTMALDMDMYLRMSWRDQSLSHNGSSLQLIDSRDTQWMPDLFMMNALSSTFQDVTQPNFMLFVYPNGTVAYSTRVTLNVACPMVLSNYPHDQQTCNIHRYTEQQLFVSWFSSGAIEYSPEINLPEFVIDGVETEDCTELFTYGKHINGSVKGRFGCVEAQLRFERSMGYHLVQTYIPTSLIVVISWVSFWIDQNAVPARITLSFTTLLTLTTQSSSVRMGLSPVSYAKAIDYWMAMCMLFVFGGLLEFAFVNSMNKRASKLTSMAAGTLAITSEEELVRPWVITVFLKVTGGQNKQVKVSRLLSVRKKSKETEESEIRTQYDDGTTQNQSTKMTDLPLEAISSSSITFNKIQADYSMDQKDQDLQKCFTQLSQDYNDVAVRVDRLSRMIFPLCFVLFVSFYMGHYAVRLF